MKQHHGSGGYYRVFSFRKHEFDSRLVHAGVVVDNVTLVLDFFRLFWFSPVNIIPLMFHIHAFIYKERNDLNP